MTQRNRNASENANDLGRQLHHERLELVASTTLEDAIRALSANRTQRPRTLRSEGRHYSFGPIACLMSL